MTSTDAAASPSPFVRGVTPITETNEQIAVMLGEAQLAPLLPALAYLTGDQSLLRPDLAPDPLVLNQPFSGFSEAQQCEIRSLAVDCLGRYRDGGCTPDEGGRPRRVLGALSGRESSSLVRRLTFPEQRVSHGSSVERRGACEWNSSEAVAATSNCRGSRSGTASSRCSTRSIW